MQPCKHVCALGTIDRRLTMLLLQAVHIQKLMSKAEDDRQLLLKDASSVSTTDDQVNHMLTTGFHLRALHLVFTL